MRSDRFLPFNKLSRSGRSSRFHRFSDDGIFNGGKRFNDSFNAKPSKSLMLLIYRAIDDQDEVSSSAMEESKPLTSPRLATAPHHFLQLNSLPGLARQSSSPTPQTTMAVNSPSNLGLFIRPMEFDDHSTLGPQWQVIVPCPVRFQEAASRRTADTPKVSSVLQVDNPHHRHRKLPWQSIPLAILVYL